MKLVLSKQAEIEAILSMIKEAQVDFKSSGIDQWQDGYPNTDTIKLDIKLQRAYSIYFEDEIVGCCVIDFEHDPNYDVVYNGQFHNEHHYATIHRFVIKRSYQHCHLGTQAFKLIEDIVKEKGIDTIRIDTHVDNLKMRGLIEKSQFKYCGIIKLNGTNDERLAFDKTLIKENKNV